MTGVTDVIIFFVGLTMWSEQLPNDCGVKAILPRVVHTKPKPGDIEAQHVPNHVAAIIFPAESYVWQVGWGEPKILGSGTPSTTSPVEVFKYVVLDSDPVRFVTTGVTNDSANLSGVTLPQLKRLCPAKQTLTAGYKTPYVGAAAVVVLPAGKLRTCLSVPAGSDGRLDTQVDLKTTGNLVISGSTMIHRKELHLKPRLEGGPIEVMIANVPEPYYRGDFTALQQDAINGMSHVNAYLEMCEPLNSTCKVSLRDWWNQLEDPDQISLCNAGTFAPTIPPITSATLTTSGANFECSNTRWP